MHHDHMAKLSSIKQNLDLLNYKTFPISKDFQPHHLSQTKKLSLVRKRRKKPKVYQIEVMPQHSLKFKLKFP